MDGMTQTATVPQPIADAIEAMVQERVVAALALEKDNRLALISKTEGDAYQRGYGDALTAVEAAWGAAMQTLWAGRERAPAALPWPFDGAPTWSQEEIAKAIAHEPGTIIPFVANRITPAVVPAPVLSEWDHALIEQGAAIPEPPSLYDVCLATPGDWPPSAAIPIVPLVEHIRRLPEPPPFADEPVTATNLYGWPEPVLDIIRRQWVRYVTEREIQNEVEAVLRETAPVWKIRAQATAEKLVRPPMPRLSVGTKIVDVTWHQATMLARGYGIAFTGDMLPFNKARQKDGRVPCRLLQPDGPTAEDLAAYGPPTL